MQLLEKLERTRDETLRYTSLGRGRSSIGSLDLSRQVYQSARNAIIHYAGMYYEPKGQARVGAQRDGGADAERRIR